MNHDELLKMAIRNQNHEPLESLPPDAPPQLERLIGKHEGFCILGYKQSPAQGTRYFLGGKELSTTDVLGYKLWRLGGRTGPVPRLIPDREEKIEFMGWYAIVQGNAVIAEQWLRTEGFPDAFAGSPSFVFVCSCEERE